MTVAEALERTPLKPGRYRYRIQGFDVELTVDPIGESSSAIPENDVMLDAWCELPSSPPLWTGRAKPGDRVWPDSLEIPPEGDKPA